MSESPLGFRDGSFPKSLDAVEVAGRQQGSMSVREWWERLGLAGWSAPELPEHAYGRGLSRADSAQVASTIAAHGALAASRGPGLLLAAPTIAKHGTHAQVERFVRPTVTGQVAWCQLFSEPNAGSDLAGLACSATSDGAVWIISGQKVWTSGGQDADYGMLLARTNPSVPKHHGISWMILDMRQNDRIQVRPLREMTGRSLFTEVFLYAAIVAEDGIVGELHTSPNWS